jgi:hypothetical protein
MVATLATRLGKVIDQYVMLLEEEVLSGPAAY